MFTTFTDRKTKTEPTIANDALSHVVVVEDESAIVSGLELCLKPRFRLEFFTTAEDALVYIHKNAQEIDLIILDVMLPGMNGLELLSIIRQDPNLKHLKIIVQSV